MAAAGPSSLILPAYVYLEEQLKRDRNEAPEVIELNAQTLLNMMNDLGTLQRNCEKAAWRLLEYAKQIQAFDWSLARPPELSCFYWCFCSRKYKKQEQERSDFVQKHLERYADIHRVYVAALSPAFTAQIKEIENILRVREFTCLTSFLDQTKITRHTTNDPPLIRLKQALAKARKQELALLIDAIDPILQSIASIQRLARSMFDKAGSIHLKLNQFLEEFPPQGNEIPRSGNGRQVSCHKRTDSSLDLSPRGRTHAVPPVQIAKDREYVFVSLESSEKTFSSKSFPHLHLALNELEDPPVTNSLKSIEIEIPERLEPLLAQSFNLIKQKVLALQGQILEV